MSEITFVRDDATLHATVTGTGPTVVLLHAGRERRGVWAPIAGILAAAGLRTVALDQRGHGESTGEASTLRAFADDVIALVHREPAPLVLVGASLGGSAALLALTDPSTASRVAGLVLVDVVPDPDPVRVRAWLDERGLRVRDPLLVEDILGAGPGLRAAAAALRVPVLLVRAQRSPLDDAAVERLRAANPRVSTVAVPGTGHLVARDAPVALAEILTAHAHAWLS